MTRLPVQNPELVFKHDGEEGVIRPPDGQDHVFE